MTLPVGTISLSDVNTELGYSSTALVSLNDSAVRSLANVPSGAISMSDLQGKSANFGATYSSNTTSGLNLRTWALANGWNGSSAATITISNGTYLQSSSTSTPALTINGSWPGGVTLVVEGYVVGAGGAGGSSNSLSPTVGNNGGPAISLGVNCSIQITSTGAILGGGGGGASYFGGGGGGAGGGAGGSSWTTYVASGGSGGFAGASGNNGTNGGNGSVFVGTGGGGGSALSGLTSGSTLAGGAGGALTYGAGGASGGGGGGSSTYLVNGSAGGNTTPSGGGSAGGNADNTNGGAGGGGFGKDGGYVKAGSTIYAGGTAGKAIALNGYTATLSGTTTNVWGAVS